MVRPKICRKTTIKPSATVFKPRGIPSDELEIVTLEMDELEAIRLSDYDGLYQEDAAEKMRISRSTYGRVISGAHYKIADALLHGKALVFNTNDTEEDKNK